MNNNHLLINNYSTNILQDTLRNKKLKVRILSLKNGKDKIEVCLHLEKNANDILVVELHGIEYSCNKKRV